MKRYAAVKVPPEGSPPPGSRMLRTGGAGGRPLGIRPHRGLALSLFSPGREPHGLDRSGTFQCLPRKEVIQPHLPVRLPCYDFTPLTLHTFDASAPRGVRPAASGADDSGGVTGGVYKARERIHRGVLIRDY